MYKRLNLRGLALALLLAAIGTGLGACVNPAGSAGCTTLPAGTACPAPAPPNFGNIVGMLQTNYPTLRAAATVYAASGLASPSEAATITAAESVADPLIAALSPTSAPQNIAAVAQAAGNLLSTGLGKNVSAGTKADIQLGISLLTSYLQVASAL